MRSFAHNNALHHNNINNIINNNNNKPAPKNTHAHVRTHTTLHRHHQNETGEK